MSNTFAGPQISVEIYPHEGGVYSIQGGKVLSCVVDKSIKSPAGAFEIMLAPGGPNGPNVGPSWLDVITPMSFVMIGMSRGQYQGIVMLGVVTTMQESWDFSTKPVNRMLKVTGQDAGYFFTHFSWYALTFINGPAAALGIQLGNEAAGSLQSIVNANANGTTAGLGGFLTQGGPDEIGKAWYLDVMDGPKGILSKTWFDYGLNNAMLFSAAVTVQFEKFSEALKILWSFSFISTEETWWQKFNKIFPFPWYEFFVITAPDGSYDTPTTTTWTTVATGSTFYMQKFGSDVKSRIYVIARVNPLPVLKASSDGKTMTFNGIDATAWGNLKEFTEDTPLLKTREEFCEEEVRNFYVVNPIFMKTLLGQANDSVIPPMLGVAAAVDPASIHRYGFRPMYMETEWFSDPTGQVAQSAAAGGSGQSGNFQQIFASLTARLCSQYEPISLMMRAERTGTLRPDIIPGNKFVYQPLKELNSAKWTFYIEEVRHSYVFGGPSTTTLRLSRGLPSDVYNDTTALTTDEKSGQQSGGILNGLHMGVAQRLNGVYSLGLPTSSLETETGLEAVNLLPDQVQKVLSDIAPIYSTAGKK